jgi:hypothetical protein
VRMIKRSDELFDHTGTELGMRLDPKASDWENVDFAQAIERSMLKEL